MLRGVFLVLILLLGTGPLVADESCSKTVRAIAPTSDREFLEARLRNAEAVRDARQRALDEIRGYSIAEFRPRLDRQGVETQMAANALAHMAGFTAGTLAGAALWWNLQIPSAEGLLGTAGGAGFLGTLAAHVGIEAFRDYVYPGTAFAERGRAVAAAQKALDLANDEVTVARRQLAAADGR